MYVWHGTSSERLDSILKHGLLPDAPTHYEGNLAPKHKGLIYITSHFPRWYADLAVDHMGGFPVLIELEIKDRAKIFNDEDYPRSLNTWREFGTGAIRPSAIIEISGVYDGSGHVLQSVDRDIVRLHHVKKYKAWEIAEMIYSDCELLI